MNTVARPPIRRILCIDRAIRSGSFPNARNLAEGLEVHRRTVLRDLDFMRTSLNAPIKYHPQRNGYFYSQPDYAMPVIRLTEGEIVSLFLAEQVMRQYQGTPFARDLAAALSKLTAALPDEISIHLDQLQGAFSVRPAPSATADVDVLSELTAAVCERRQLELEYWSAGRDEMTCRRVDPYHLTAISGEWYLIAYCHSRGDVRMFVPARVRSLRETGERFERPGNFEVAAYLGGSFRAMRGGKPRTVRLRFGGAAARYIRERIWHPSQVTHERPNGEVDLTLQVTHLLEVQRWVLSWGSECEVLAPRELKLVVMGEAKRVGAIYEGSQGVTNGAR